MDRLARERDTLSRHLRQSQAALEEFRELHESELSVAQEREEDLVADNAALREALASKNGELDKLRDAFERLLSFREAQLDAGPSRTARDAPKYQHGDQGYDSEEAEQEPFESPPSHLQEKKLLHARQLAIDLAKELERTTQGSEKLQEQRDAALMLLQARQEVLEGIQSEVEELRRGQSQDATLANARHQMQRVRESSLHELLQAAPAASSPSAKSSFSQVLQDIDMQISHTKSTLKVLLAERRTMDPDGTPPLDSDANAQVEEIKKSLQDREQQLEDLTRSAREALEAQSSLLDVKSSEKEQSEQELQEAQKKCRDLQEQLSTEQDKTRDLTSRLESLVQGLDQATQAKG